MRIGVLALQGAFIEHRRAVESLNATSIELRQKRDLSKQIDGIILPGGESTAIGKLLVDLDLLDTMRDLINGGMPVFGTCAGMILLAKTIVNSPINHLATMDIVVVRNAYGRQLGSFETWAAFADDHPLPMTFIRAPYIQSVGEEVKVLARVDGKIVAAQQKNQLATSFHPELTDSTEIHGYFLRMIRNQQLSL